MSVGLDAILEGTGLLDITNDSTTEAIESSLGSLAVHLDGEPLARGVLLPAVRAKVSAAGSPFDADGDAMTILAQS